MLQDIRFDRHDPMMALVLDTLGGSPGSREPTRLSEGLYLSKHWSVNKLTNTKLNIFPVFDGIDLDSYGVCDSPEQLMELCGDFLKNSRRQFFVAFVRLAKAAQSPTGGWRWRKWGPYVGKQNPQTQYLYDEPVIEEVYTYHIYEIIN